MASEVCGEGLVEIVKESAALFGACRDRGPHSLVIALAYFTARALRDQTVDHAETHLLFGVIVCRVHAVLKQKPEIVIRQIVAPPVFQLDQAEPIRQVLRPWKPEPVRSAR